MNNVRNNMNVTLMVTLSRCSPEAPPLCYPPHFAHHEACKVMVCSNHSVLYPLGW